MLLSAWANRSDWCSLFLSQGFKPWRSKINQELNPRPSMFTAALYLPELICWRFNPVSDFTLCFGQPKYWGSEPTYPSGLWTTDLSAWATGSDWCSLFLSDFTVLNINNQSRLELMTSKTSSQGFTCWATKESLRGFHSLFWKTGKKMTTSILHCLLYGFCQPELTDLTDAPCFFHISRALFW